MTQLIRILAMTWLFLPGLAILSHAADQAAPPPSGKMVDLGGHHLHVHCTGHGSPPVLVETGLGDFSFDWTLVQARVARFTRICTYDRAGYAWSDPGPLPRSFAQINLELHDALQKLGEKGPFVLVGHSYGGPVVRNYASVYPDEVAGIVLVDAAHEGLRVQVGPKQTIRLGADVQQQPIPPPHEELQPSDKPTDLPSSPPQPTPLEPMYKSLPPPSRNCTCGPRTFPGSMPPKTVSANGRISPSLAGWRIRPTPPLATFR